MNYELEMRNITKRFGEVVANNKNTLQIKKGEVHALVGENGAGKSTLMNILYGLIEPDEGEIYIRGDKVHFKSPNDAITLGIGMVHQHFMLSSSMTVAENIVAGYPPDGKFIWKKEDLKEKIDKMQKDFDMPVPLNSLVSDISVGQMQRVEIIKTLYRGVEIIILDEPTAVLTPQETEQLFLTIRKLRNSGHTVIFISHKLKEVMEIADRVTVLRNGQVVGTSDIADVTSSDIARMMIGKDMSGLNIEPFVPGETIFEIQNLTVLDSSKAKLVDTINFKLRAGEVLGIAGVEGNGQTELSEALLGVRTVDSGNIFYKNKDITSMKVRNRIEDGIATIPQNRMREGVALNLSVLDNIIIGHHYKKPLSKNNIMNWESAKDFSKRLIEKFYIKTPSSVETVENLSGGNIQKVIVAREISREPELVIACQPTNGVDIGTAEYIHQELLNIRNKGGAVILISADLDEILKLSDRIMVMYDGKKSGELNKEDATEELLGRYMFGLKDKEGGNADGKPKTVDEK